MDLCSVDENTKVLGHEFPTLAFADKRRGRGRFVKPRRTNVMGKRLYCTVLDTVRPLYIPLKMTLFQIVHYLTRV